MAVDQPHSVSEQLRLLATEFAAPLQYITAASEFISSYEAALPKAVTDQLRGIQLTSRRLLQMTDLLLLHEGITSGQLPLQLEPVNIAAVAHEAYASRLRLHHLQPTHEYIDVTTHAWPAQSDRAALRGALEALCDMLIQTSDKPLGATARVVKRDDNVELQITDDGPIVLRKSFQLSQPDRSGHGQPLEGLRAHSLLAFSVARDLVTSVRGRLTMASTDAGRRHTIVSLPMTKQLDLLRA